jgi:hypothetical protein
MLELGESSPALLCDVKDCEGPKGPPDDNDDVYLRLQHGKGLQQGLRLQQGFQTLVYMSYIKHINPASKA